MDANTTSRIIIDAAMKIHSKLGPGLLDSAYEACPAYELGKRGVSVQTQVGCLFAMTIGELIRGIASSCWHTIV